MPNYVLADLLQGQKLQLEIDAVANALRELWQQAAPPVARRNELNLMVLLTDAHLAEQVVPAVTEFSRLHPTRAFVILADAAAEQREETTYLSFECLPDSQTVCCEQITLRIRGTQAVQELPQKVWPLLVAMQPILFWSVQGLPESSSLIERLQKTSAKLLFDSALAPELGITLARANELVEDWPGGVLADLNWQRLAAWREVLAQALAHPAFQKHAGGIHKVSITFGGGDLDEARLGQPALLVSWLASQFGWKLSESLSYQQNAFHATWEHQGREIICEVQTSAEPQPEVLALQLHAQSAEQNMVLSLAKTTPPETPGLLQCTLMVMQPEPQETLEILQQEAPELSLAQLLAQEYARQDRDAEFESVLRLATKLV